MASDYSSSEGERNEESRVIEETSECESSTHDCVEEEGEDEFNENDINDGNNVEFNQDLSSVSPDIIGKKVTIAGSLSPMDGR